MDKLMVCRFIMFVNFSTQLMCYNIIDNLLQIHTTIYSFRNMI